MKRLCVVLIALLALSLSAVSQEQNRSPALASLVAAERAFARTSVERGIRDSFLAFFADDGINFQPHPTKTREAFLSAPPAPTVQAPITLNWEPVWADVSGAGDLGFTTGPYTLTDNSPQQRPTRHGYFFSIWKKQPGGDWKVVLDVGTQNPAPAPQPPAFHAARSSAAHVRGSRDAKRSREEGRAALLELERTFLKETRARGFLKAFVAYLTDESRLHRQQQLPLIGSNAINRFLALKPPVAAWSPLFADIAESGDFGYVYGTYELKDNPAQASAIEKGYFVRVWKLGQGGKWKVALDLNSPLPPEQK